MKPKKYLRNFFYLHKTHAAVSSNWQALVVAEAGNLHACFLTRLWHKTTARLYWMLIHCCEKVSAPLPISYLWHPHALDQTNCNKQLQKYTCWCFSGHCPATQPSVFELRGTNCWPDFLGKRRIYGSVITTASRPGPEVEKQPWTKTSKKVNFVFASRLNIFPCFW